VVGYETWLKVDKLSDAVHAGRGAILVLCHRRTEHLQKVLDSLVNCANIENFTTVFVVQDPIPPVLKIVEAFPTDKRVLTVDGSSYSSPAQAINGNLFRGLNYVFWEMASDYVIVLEDDIVVSKDSLIYFTHVIHSFRGVRSFRGVNGFSMLVPPISLSNAFVKTHFGLGWGWATDKRNFKRILRYWKGSEDDHWDFIFEPYIRSGFVVNPLRSRILNIGFDETATHTAADSSLGASIHESHIVPSDPNHPPGFEVDIDFIWRSRILNYCKLSLINRFSFLVLYFLYFGFGNSRIYHRVRRFFIDHYLI
jgi:hypothetical protein